MRRMVCSNSALRFSMVAGLAVSTVPMANLVSRTVNSLKSAVSRASALRCVEISRRGRENLLPVLLDVFARDFCQFGSDALVARRAGGRAQDQRIVEQSGQQQAGSLAWNGDACFVIQAGDDGACAAYRVGAEHDWPVGMHIGDAVMIDDAQQFRFIDAIHRLRLARYDRPA